MQNIVLIIVFHILINRSFASIHIENLTVTYGENVRFYCQFPINFSSKENIIQWKKLQTTDENSLISINGKIPKIFENSYKTNLTDEYSTLELFNVNKHDSTTYICQTFETQTILCQYNLVVLIKPEAPLLTVNNENIEEYQAVTLTCSSLNGNPPPQYTWFRNNTLLTSLNKQVITTGNSSIYTFNATRYDNNIKYECQISNQALEKPFRIEKYLHVKYRPSVTILEDNLGIENSTKNLTCLVDANPPPISIYWLRNETMIISRENIVYLPRLTSEQTGIYTCIVENSIGKVNQSIYLNVQYSPRVRSMESQIIVNRSDSVLLQCIIDSNPLPYSIKWFKNNTEVIRNNHQQLNDLYLNHVERNDSGLYTCLASNRFSNNQIKNGSTTIELIVQTRPIIETTYSKIAAEINQSINLTCKVFSQPQANILWKSNEQIIPCDDIQDNICYLKFERITKNDFGAYQCVAENLLGREEWTYYIVARGKPETPTDILVSEITASSFKIQFAPAFDGGSGSQQFVIQFTDSLNSSMINQHIPFNKSEYSIKGLNESTLYLFRIKSVNIYGESPWSNQIPVQTNELIITSDDLPQLHVVSYNSKEHYLQFDYLPDTSRVINLNEEQLCLNIRHSSDGKFYQSIQECLPVKNHRVNWQITKDFSYLKLSICSKKFRNICGQEIEMKEEINNRYFTPMIIGIIGLTNILIVIIIIIIISMYCRLRNRRIQSNMKNFDKNTRPIISDPHLQNPYLLYSNAHSSPYDYEYQQQKYSSSFSHAYDIVDRDQPRSSPQSNSNPSSESSCATQNTNETHANYYGFPSTMSHLKHQGTSSSSENSTPNRMKKLFYEVVV